jgi:hypothetical protein
MTAVYFRLRLRDHKWGQKINPSPQKQFFLLSPLLLTIAMAVVLIFIRIPLGLRPEAKANKNKKNEKAKDKLK